ncbi:deleted in malignant brain tumors 1 protein-like [Mercenaria mercenaria]|uniref:deleted in malignant brain tumors 1 protein-like n=1 Tax=Mercenaria mercenaria TaxID=6596 RepID=UPI00234E7AC1|nr:deleted in malignant brain tumors 1 protein-like [Mercenaria mercenaria]
MDYLLRITITVILAFSNTEVVNGQWCSGSTLSLVASSSSVGQISSIYYPAHYVNYVDCTYDITASGTDQVLFYVEYEECEFRFDHLKIYSDNVTNYEMYNSDGDFAPYIYTTTGDTLVATFATDGSITYGGFLMSYIAVDRTNLPACGSSIAATSSYQQLSFVHLSSQSRSICTWTITPADTTGTYSVQIDILLVHNYVVIEEGGGTYYYSTQNSVYVSAAYPSSVQVTGEWGSDFVVQYKQVLSTVTGIIQTTTLASDTSVCDRSYRTSTSTTQYLNSPNYPGQYEDNLYCTVTIEADNSSQSVFVNISDYTVATFDSLGIYDGPNRYYNLISSDISTGSNFTSSASSLTLLFHTNDYGQNRGFELTYYSVDRETPTCDQSYTLDWNVTSSATEQTILSPNYPSYYDNNDDRYWLIMKPLESDNIVLDFRVFKVELANDCVYDYVSIYDGACTNDPLLAKVCGEQPVTFEDSTGLYILIHFHTDFSVTKTGWKLIHYIGEYQDPDANASTEDSKTGVPNFIYPVIGIVVILIVIISMFIYLYCKGKGRVGVGDAKASLKKRTTNDLLKEMKTGSGTTEKDKQPKIKRKGNKYHPEPNAPGPDTTIINIREQSPHPPPGETDSDIPPAFTGTESETPEQNIAPAITQLPNTDPSPPEPDPWSALIPPPFPYKTPAEARALGLHG